MMKSSSWGKKSVHPENRWFYLGSWPFTLMLSRLKLSAVITPDGPFFHLSRATQILSREKHLGFPSLICPKTNCEVQVENKKKWKSPLRVQSHQKLMRIHTVIKLLVLIWVTNEYWPITTLFTINCGKFWKRWEYQTTWYASWKSVCRSGSNS